MEEMAASLTRGLAHIEEETEQSLRVGLQVMAEWESEQQHP